MFRVDSLLRKRFENKKPIINQEELSSMIRHKRKKLNKTQAEVSEGVCSISYLSKIENNATNLNTHFITQIMERVELGDFIDRIQLDNSILMEYINAYIYENSDSLESIYLNLQNEKEITPLFLLINTNKLIDEQKKDEAHNLLKQLYEIKNSLTNESLLFFIYLSLKFYVKCSRFADAKDMCDIVMELDITNQKLRYILYVNIYIIYNELGCYALANKLKSQLDSMALDIKSQLYILESELTLAKSIGKEHFHQAIKILYILKDKYKSTQDLELILRTEIVIRLENEDYDEIEDLITSLSSNKFKYIYSVIYYYKTDQFDLLKDTYQDYPFSDFEEHYKLFNLFISFIIDSNGSVTLKNNIRKHIIPKSMVIKNNVFNHIYYSKLMRLLLEDSRYKEMVLLMKKYYKFNHYVLNVV